MRLLLKNGYVLDTRKMKISGPLDILLSDGIIAKIGKDLEVEAEETIDASGKFVLPGFIDAHVHMRLTTLNFARIAQMTEVEFGIAMAQIAEATVKRGFTTVRDTGGELGGLLRAIAAGVILGPRIVHANLMISQTGGHGDVEGGPRPVPDCACQMRHSAFGIVADGPDAVQKAARHVLRDGADFLKIHVSGGVASPSDPLECTQYTAEEIRAAVREAENRNTYVTAHAYTSEAIQLAIENGVKCIEHGNLMDQKTAEMMAKKDVTLVPTLITYKAMDEFGEKLGVPASNMKKNLKVLDDGLRALAHAKAAGVTIGWGTDLIGETQPLQARESELRSQVQTPEEILTSMYKVNPALLGLGDTIGAVEEGMAADLVISTVNPLIDIAAMGDTEKTVAHVIQNGKPIS